METVKGRCYTVNDLLVMLGASRPTVYKLLKSQPFRVVKLNGGMYRIPKESFDKWMSEQNGDILNI